VSERSFIDSAPARFGCKAMPDLESPEYGSRRPPPEDVAALVNALLVVLVPFVVGIADSMGLFMPDNTVRPSIPSGYARMADQFLHIATAVIPFAPFALIVGWRTWVHAKRYLEGQGTGWQGVAEGGAVGFVFALIILRGGIVTRPAEAPPYVVAYGGLALIVGLAIGVVLRLTGILVLKLQRR